MGLELVDPAEHVLQAFDHAAVDRTGVVVATPEAGTDLGDPVLADLGHPVEGGPSFSHRIAQLQHFMGLSGDLDAVGRGAGCVT